MSIRDFERRVLRAAPCGFAFAGGTALRLRAGVPARRGAGNRMCGGRVRIKFGRVDLDWKQYVEQDPRYLRPTEVDYLLGDPSKAKAALEWAPKTSFEKLVNMMVDHDLDLARQEKTLREAGHEFTIRGSAHG